MRAIVKDITRAEHPRFDSVSGASVATPVIEFAVEYRHDNGDLHSVQRYAFLPEEFQDATVFNRQAEIMQREIDDAIRTAQQRDEAIAVIKPVDDKVAALRQSFKLDLGEKLPLNDLKG